MDGNIKIESNGTGGKVMLDGTDISNMLMGVDIHMRGGEAPEIGFELCNLETMLYEVEHGLVRSDRLVTTAIAIIRAELLKRGDLYNGFLASIESAIQEKADSAGLWYNDIFIDTEDWAESVLERIIGEE